MAKKLISLRASDFTNRQNEDLTGWMGVTRTEAIAYAVDKLWQQMRHEADATHANPNPPSREEGGIQ